jgi:bifunctional non-homologous end joining protein LigD
MSTMTIKPMLVASGPLRPDSDKYAFEVKWDGFRAVVRAAPKGVQVASRNGFDMTARYPELQGLANTVKTSVLLDGEIVVLGDDGRPDFAELWCRSRGSSDRRVCFMAFDLLESASALLVDHPYHERRHRLEDLGLNATYWSTPPADVGDGGALFAATKEMGLEGVVAKRRDSRYRPGLRSKAWTKTKHFQKRNFALLGWLPPHEWRQDRGCIVVGLRGDSGIAMAGVVESGYGQDLVERLPQLTRPQLRAMQNPGHMWDGGAPLIAQVKYLEWSPMGGFRHATISSVEGG